MEPNCIIQAETQKEISRSILISVLVVAYVFFLLLDYWVFGLSLFFSEIAIDASNYKQFSTPTFSIDPCIITIQLDPDNSNSHNSKSPLIRSNSHSPWSALLLIFTSLTRTIFFSSWDFELTGSNCNSFKDILSRLGAVVNTGSLHSICVTVLPLQIVI